MATIYVPLRDEALDVWRPVEAEGEGGAIYRISDAPAPPDEAWEFSPGSRVRCEWRELEGDRHSWPSRPSDSGVIRES